MAKEYRLPQIQVHYIEPDGRTGVINYMTSDNIETIGNDAKRARLVDKATRLAGAWANIYPTTRFVVKEV